MAGATREGVRFEVDREKISAGVRYRYDLAPVDGEDSKSWSVGRQLADIASCPLGTGAPKCSPAWWALKAGSIDVASKPLQPSERFGLLLAVEGPAPATGAEALKALIDSVVCALQSHANPGTAAEPARRLAGLLGLNVQKVAACLQLRQHAVLGARPNLVQLWGKTVQWLPDDHLCVAADVRFAQGRVWRVGGRVVVLK